MRNINQLRQRAKDLRAKGRATLEQVKALEAKETRTDDEEQKLKALNAELDLLETDLEAATAAVDAEERKIARERLFGGAALVPARQITSSEPNPAGTGGFRNLAEFALAVRSATPGGGAPRIDERLTAMYQAAPTNYHQEAGASEGYQVPPDFRTTIWEMVFDQNDLLSMVAPEPTNSNQVGMMADETTPWGATGVIAKWRAEASQMTPSKLITNERMVKLHELFAFVLATEELLADAPRLNDRLTRRAAMAINWKASDAIMWGTGAGQPFGFMSAGCLVTQAAEGGQTAGTIVTNNISKMYSRLLAQPGSKPIWIANRDTVPQLVGLTIGNQPIWTGFNAGLREAPAGVMMGYPIMYSEHSQTLGTVGDIVLADLAGYYATQRAGEGVKFDTSIHLYFDYAIQAFRWMFRLGGQPYLSAAVSPNKGATTKSHFVALATR